MTTAKKIGTVGVDSGLLLLVDPGYLFTDDEWSRICDKAFAYSTTPVPGKCSVPDFPRAVLEGLGGKVAENKMDKLALVFSTHVGDGRYTVTDQGDSFSVDA